MASAAPNKINTEDIWVHKISNVKLKCFVLKKHNEQYDRRYWQFVQPLAIKEKMHTNKSMRRKYKCIIDKKNDLARAIGLVPKVQSTTLKMCDKCTILSHMWLNVERLCKIMNVSVYEI